jgi:hypothetical protein
VDSRGKAQHSLAALLQIIVNAFMFCHLAAGTQDEEGKAKRQEDQHLFHDTDAATSAAVSYRRLRPAPPAAFLGALMPDDYPSQLKREFFTRLWFWARSSFPKLPAPSPLPAALIYTDAVYES